MEIPLERETMRMRVHRIEEQACIAALRSTFSSPNPMRSNREVDEMSFDEIRRIADAQISNILKIGKLARNAASFAIDNHKKGEEKNEKNGYELDVAYTMLKLSK
tara:strand:- start:1206 stop:1520 length:315 start_codon:yes stop_codon:yes gene_type:complete